MELIMLKEKEQAVDDTEIKVLSIEELNAQIEQSLIDSKLGRLIKASDLIDKIIRFESSK